MSDESWRDQLPDQTPAPDWVRGWALARFRNRDFRLWPEQQTGYGDDWPTALETQGLMPATDREDYVAEGLTVPFHGLAALMTSVVVAEPKPPQPDPIPALADDDPIPF